MTDPVFRSADEVIEFPNKMGWVGDHNQEARYFDKLAQELPKKTTPRDQGPIAQPLWDKWVQFQKDKGRYDGSYDWTLLDEFVLGRPLHWLPQSISVIMNSAQTT